MEADRVNKVDEVVEPVQNLKLIERIESPKPQKAL